MADSLRRRLLGALGMGAGALGLTRPAQGTGDPATSAPIPPPAPPSGPDGFGVVSPAHRLRFPADHGAHPTFRTEWWYLTGWLDGADGAPPQGVQITFFRSRTGHAPANPSRFAPHQLLFAHAALARPDLGRLLHDQRAAREGFGWAGASTANTDVRIGDWRLTRSAEGPESPEGSRYRARIAAADFDLDLSFTSPLPPVAQGEGGYSRKGPRPAQASHYYSRPQLQVDGSVRLHQRASTSSAESRGRSDPAAAVPVRGLAWLDHEWSTEVLDPSASGWDWCGLNLDDGSALMAFAIRDHTQQSLWSHARLIDARGRALDPQLSARFLPLRWWQSLRTGVRYPVAMQLTVGTRVLELEPLFEDQELDSRGSTGAIYWEGAVRVHEAGRAIGRGYLELTGYGSRLAI